MTDLTVISGWVAAIFITLNFLTCLATPWSKTKCLWQVNFPGKDKCDPQGFRPIAYTHRIFVWLSIVAVIFHVILAIAR